MKRTVAAIFSFFAIPCLFSAALADEVTVDSRISEVTVYPDSAMISRAAQVRLEAGSHQVVFSPIIPQIDESSLRVSAKDGQAVKILGARVKREHLTEEVEEKARSIREKIQALEDERRKQEDVKKVLEDDKDFLDSVRLFSAGQLPKDLITKFPAVKDLDDTLKFLDTKLRENRALQMEADLQIRELLKKLEALRKELADISGAQRKIKQSVAVELEAQRPFAGEIMISYLVRGAYWQPLYDARADFDKAEVELVSYGIVQQKTGEDWVDVAISLSTARPAVGGRMPYVAPWLLKPFVEKAERKGALMYKSSRVDDRAQMMAFAPESGALEAEEEAQVRVEEKGIAVVYKLPQKATIKSDGTEQKLGITSQALKARFEYSSFPRALLQAYLGSRVANAPNLQLLSGKVNIFLSGDFVGSSSIDSIGPGEEFDLYLGADENVKVKRDLVERKVDETLIAGIPSPNRVTSFKYKLTVENYKSKKIKMKLFEAMPVSQDDKIKVKLGSISLEPGQKDWQDRKGVWAWEFELEPKEKKEIFYNFSVEHPRDMRVEGL